MKKAMLISMVATILPAIHGLVLVIGLRNCSYFYRIRGMGLLRLLFTINRVGHML
jgi:hypothetical protein